MSESTLDQVLAHKREAHRDIVNVDEPVVKLVVFELADQWFAIAGERIREILAQAEVFFVPGCPASLEGVINVRGDIASVIRLNDLLNLPEPPLGKASSILLGHAADMTSGIRVERVVDVVDLPQSAIQAPPGTLPEHMRPIVAGVLHFQGRPVTVLDLDRLFADYARGLG